MKFYYLAYLDHRGNVFPCTEAGWFNGLAALSDSSSDVFNRAQVALKPEDICSKYPIMPPFTVNQFFILEAEL